MAFDEDGADITNPLIRLQLNWKLKELLQEVQPHFEYDIQEVVAYERSPVYRAVRRDTGQDIAVKRVKLRSSSWADFRQAFQQDAEQFKELARLSHPNILQYLGLELKCSSLTDGEMAWIMEYCSGGTLFRRAQLSGGLSEAQVKFYARQIIDGLAFLHTHNILHLDIRGANILLTENGTIKFGGFDEMVKLQSTTPTRLTNEINSDTVRYKAPEMINYNHGGRGRASDIWSFGCLIIEMLTGQMPQYKHPVHGGYLTDQWQLTDYVGNGRRPELPPTDAMSYDLRLLLTLCLKTDSRKRASVHELKLQIDSWANSADVISAELQKLMEATRPPFEYDIKELIGHGKDRVYRGIRRDTGQKIAVKKILLRSRPGLPTWGDVLLDLKKCAEQFIAVVELKHPNIVQYLGLEFEVGTEESFVILLMEYCSGGTLLGKSQSYGGLPEARVKRYARQIIEGLVCIHSNSICHLDIKGENIFLTEHDTIKLGDFGEIVMLQSASRTRPDEVPHGAGTLFYSAPEMVNSEFTGRGRAADIYSFGCLIIEMVTGKKPQYKHHTGRYITEHAALIFFIGNGGRPQFPAPELTGGDLSRLLEQCIQREPPKRPIASQLLQLLGSF